MTVTPPPFAECSFRTQTEFVLKEYVCRSGAGTLTHACRYLPGIEVLTGGNAIKENDEHGNKKCI